MFEALLSQKMTLVVITLAGMAMCSAGIGMVAARNQWLHPMAFVGYALGITILVVAVGALAGVKLPMVDSTRTAIIVMVALMAVKIVLTQIHRFTL